MMKIEEKIAVLCSIALYEFYLRHREDLPGMAGDARKISDAIDDMIESELFQKEN